MTLLDRAKHPSFAAARRIGMAAAVVGGLDLAYAVMINATYGLRPLQVLQYIGSGLLGAAAFRGGVWTAFIGAVCHFALMTAFVLAVATGGAVLCRHGVPRLVIGVLSGLALFGIMTGMVVPLSNTPPVEAMGLIRWLLELGMHGLVVGPLVAILVLPRSLPSSDEGASQT